MTWDVNVTNTLAESYLSATAAYAGSAAEVESGRKELKYQSLASAHTFIPFAFETLVPVNSKGVAFSLSLVGVLQTALATCDKLHLSFSACRQLSSSLMPSASMGSFCITNADPDSLPALVLFTC